MYEGERYGVNSKEEVKHLLRQQGLVEGISFTHPDREMFKNQIEAYLLRLLIGYNKIHDPEFDYRFRAAMAGKPVPLANPEYDKAVMRLLNQASEYLMRVMDGKAGF